MNNYIKTLMITALTLGTLALSSQYSIAGMLGSNSFTAEQLSTVKLNIHDAITKANKQQAGTVINATLEKEDGKLTYVVKIFSNGQDTEIMVDAVDGKVSVNE